MFHKDYMVFRFGFSLELRDKDSFELLAERNFKYHYALSYYEGLLYLFAWWSDEWIVYNSTGRSLDTKSIQPVRDRVFALNEVFQVANGRAFTYTMDSSKVTNLIIFQLIKNKIQTKKSGFILNSLT
jgi:hypothetical protein